MSYSASDLETADRHVSQAEQHVVSQERIISNLLLHGAPVETAEALLVEFQETLRIHREHRDAIAAALARSR